MKRLFRFLGIGYEFMQSGCFRWAVQDEVVDAQMGAFTLRCPEAMLKQSWPILISAQHHPEGSCASPRGARRWRCHICRSHRCALQLARWQTLNGLEGSDLPLPIAAEPQGRSFPVRIDAEKVGRPPPPLRSLMETMAVAPVFQSAVFGELSLVSAFGPAQLSFLGEGAPVTFHAPDIPKDPPA